MLIENCLLPKATPLALDVRATIRFLIPVNSYMLGKVALLAESLAYKKN